LKTQMLSNQMAWFYSGNQAASPNSIQKDNFVFYHLFYEHNRVVSPFYDKIILPILNNINCKALDEARANLVTNRDTAISSKFHTDRNYANSLTAIYYINTNNGYTLLDEEQRIKIDCVENKILIFDSQIKHAAVSQTDTNRRIIININYF